MNKMRNFWILLLPLVLLLGLLGFFFRDTLVMLFAPKAVLSGAISDAYSQLETRFQGNPLLELAKNLDLNGEYSADLTLKTSNQLLGDIAFELDAQTNLKDHQITASGTAYFGNGDLDISAYLDDKYMAVSSRDLLQGGWYGLTYDSFESDIRSIPLLSFMLPKSMVSQWGDSLRDIQETISTPVLIPDLPEITEEDMKLVMVGVLAMPSKTVKETFAVGEQTYSGHKITYSAKGSQLVKIADIFMDVQGADTAELTASFYLHEKQLLRLDLSGTAGSNRFFCRLDLGENPQKEPLHARYEKTENGVDSCITVKNTARITAESYGEDWELNLAQGREEKPIAFSYDWNPATGDTRLVIRDSEPLSLKVTTGENQVTIVSEDMTGLLCALTETPRRSAEGGNISGEVILRNGSAVTMPEFKNLDQWSFDDFFVLLGGIGALLGLSV